MISLDFLLEKDILPDPLMRAGIRHLLAQKIKEETRGGVEEQQAALMAPRGGVEAIAHRHRNPGRERAAL